MANLTAPRNTPEYVDNTFVTVEAGGTIYEGGMVAINSSGKAVAAADTAGLKVIGRAENPAVSGDKVKIRMGVFGWDNDQTNAVAAKDVGKLCYVVDDHTVSIDDQTNGVVAGVVKGVDADGVHVAHGPIFVSGTVGIGAAVADLTAAGDLTYTKINAILAALRQAGVIAPSAS